MLGGGGGGGYKVLIKVNALAVAQHPEQLQVIGPKTLFSLA